MAEKLGDWRCLLPPRRRAPRPAHARSSMRSLIAHDTLDFGVLGLLGQTTTSRQASQRAPSTAMICSSRRRAVRQHARAALLQRGQCIGGAEQRLGAAPIRAKRRR